MFSLVGILKGLLIENEVDRTKQLIIQVSPSSTTNTATTVVSQQTSNRTITLPDETFTIGTPDSVETFTNKTIDASLNTITNLANASIASNAAIDATKIADGSVSNSAFEQLNGVTSPVVDTSSIQTLSNKSIDASTNTLSNIPLTDLLTVPGDANNFLVRNGSGVVVSNTKVVPTGTVVGTSDSQVLTNKDIDGATASNTDRITIPKDTLANLTALSRKQATVVYGSDTLTTYVDNGTSLVPLAAAAFGPFTDNRVLRADGTSNIQDSAVTLTDAGGLTGLTDVAVGTLDLSTNIISSSNNNIVLTASTSTVIKSNLVQVRPTSGTGKFSLFEDTSTGNNRVDIFVPNDLTANREAYLPDWDVFLGSSNVTNQSSAYPATINDGLILCDSSGGTFTVTLPTAANNNGKQIVIKKTDSSFNAVNIATTGGQTIDGASSTTLNTENECLTLIAAGNNWQVLDRKIPSFWQAATFRPDGSGFVSQASQQSFIRRVGDSLECHISLTLNVVGAAPGYIVFPAAFPYSIDTTLVRDQSLPIGTWWGAHSGTQYTFDGSLARTGPVGVNVATPDRFFPSVIGNSGLMQTFTANSYFASGNSDVIYMKLTVPISGWNS